MAAPTVDPAAVRTRRQANEDRGLRLAAAFGTVVFVLLAVVLSLALGVLAGLLLGLVLAASLTALAFQRADDLVLWSVGGRVVTHDDEPRLSSLLDVLSVASGVPRPELRMLDTSAANLLTVGRGQRGTTVLATTGLRDELNRIELEGVLAHAVTRIDRGETALATTAAATVGLPILVGDALHRAGGWRRAVSWLLVPFGRLSAAVLAGLVEPGRDLRHDLEGIALTRYPPGLVAAFEKLQTADTRLPTVSPATAPLAVLPPLDPDDPRPLAGLGARTVVHDPLDLRTELLRDA